MRLLLFKLMAVLVLLTAWGSSAFGAASADIDGSGKVDFNDLAIMQKYWLGAGPVADIGGADGNSDGVVDGVDFSVLGGSWLDDTSETIRALVTEAVEFSSEQVAATHAGWSDFSNHPKQTIYDSDFNDHYEIWEVKSNSDWTSGFFAGCLWYMYELTGDPNYKDAVEDWWLPALESQQYDSASHNVGYKMMSSFGVGYELTNEPNYLPILLQSAQSYASRFIPAVGCIHSRGKGFPEKIFVTIDNMPTLEILFWGAKNGGDPNWYDMAVSHAYKTAENHVRVDGTTNHRLYYDPCDGSVIGNEGGPGYSADSAWSRGQGWAVYGFTMCYRETGDPNILAAAQLVSDYFVDNLPADFVPFYDFNDPNIPNTIRDSSAASVAASGLLELSTLVSDPNYQQKYFQAAKDILTSLCTRHSDSGYLAKDAVGDPLSLSILMRGYKNLIGGPKLYERGTSWGDYYFVEALMRYKAMTEP